MKIIIKEEQLKRIIKEAYDESHYNAILDKYNEVGLEGMDQDEIDYLKSGGESDTPSMFKQDDETPYSFESEGYEKIRLFGEIMDAQTYDVMPLKDTNPEMFLVKIPYSEEVLNEVLNIFGGENSEDLYGNPIKVRVNHKNNIIGVALSVAWYDQLFGDEMI
jgi:hypothetical protein